MIPLHLQFLVYIYTIVQPVMNMILTKKKRLHKNSKRKKSYDIRNAMIQGVNERPRRGGTRVDSDGRKTVYKWKEIREHV
jgi:hypothetical protein